MCNNWFFRKRKIELKVKKSSKHAKDSNCQILQPAAAIFQEPESSSEEEDINKQNNGHQDEEYNHENTDLGCAKEMLLPHEHVTGNALSQRQKPATKTGSHQSKNKTEPYAMSGKGF